MINQTLANNSAQTDSDPINSIDMPSRFTSAEANYYKQLFQDFNPDSKPLATKAINVINNRMRFNFENTITIDQGGLAGLCQLVTLAHKNQIDLTFSKLSPEIKIIFSLIGLEDLFPIAE